MALILHSSSTKPHLLLLRKTPLSSRCNCKPLKFSIKAQESSSESSKPSISSQSAGDTSNTGAPTPKKPDSAGRGFGSSSPYSSGKAHAKKEKEKKKQRDKRERASIIRRAPVESAGFVPKTEEVRGKEQSKNETAFLLAWLGLGGLILVEGMALAASGFLPEEWDNLFVKYVYPSFTPTVFLFVAGTVVYGVYKYLQNDDLNTKK